MKATILLLTAAIAVIATGGTSAFATNMTFSETISGINYGIEGQAYNGTFTDANLKSGSTVFNNTLETITSATVYLTILNDVGLPISLTIDGVTQDMTPSHSPQTLTYNLTSTEYNYIQAQDGTFGYKVIVDCELTSAQLVVNTTSSGSNSRVPDGGTTLTLLGGAMATLGLIKRQLRSAKR